MTVIVAYHNLFDTGTVSATSEETDFPKENAYDWLPGDSWKPTTPSPFVTTTYLTVDMTTAAAADYMAVFGHDLADNSATITAQWSTDNFAADINDAATASAPTDSRPIFVTWTSLSKRYWRIKVVSASVVSNIGHFCIGVRVDMPKGINFGWQSPHLGYQGEMTTSRAEKGTFLGTTVRRSSATTSISFSGVTKVWIDANWAAFAAHIESKPFFLSPGYTTADAAFCWRTGRLPTPQLGEGDLMGFTLAVQALTR